MAVLDVSGSVMSVRVVGRVAVDAAALRALTEREAEALASGGSGRPVPEAAVAAAALEAAAYDEIYFATGCRPVAGCLSRKMVARSRPREREWARRGAKV